MNYVEMLRVRNCLRCLGYCLIGLVVLMVVIRFTAQVTETSSMTVSDREGAMTVFFAIAGFAGLIVATVLGVTFARENEGHLEFALTKPVSRERYALAAMATDGVGILIAETLTLVVTIACFALFVPPAFDVTHVSAAVVLISVIGPLAWYVFLNALTASLKRGASTVMGLSWFVTFLIIGIAEMHLTTPVGVTIHAIAWVVSRLIPLTYMSISSHGNEMPVPPIGHAGILAVLLVVYGALTVWQWRRVEA